MDWRSYWDKVAAEADPHRQVARTGGQVPIDAALMARMSQRLVELLDLQASDRLLDLCCGNGMVTRALAPHCRETVGVDLAPGQIARALDGPPVAGLHFRTGDVTRLEALGLEPFDKINLHFSFQYLDQPGQGQQALAGMAALLRPGGRILLGDVPDRDRLAVFFPRRWDRLRYHLHLRLGRSLMGKFWSLAEIQQLARPLGLQATALPQPTGLPYAHYRTDFLLTQT